jgi:pSer/pThr/pTyr-binding forkhead associated (FHA) protein
MMNFKSSLNSCSLLSADTIEDPELSQRLGLYQLFLKLYHQNRGLLDEILSLENFGGKQACAVKQPYIQGVVVGQQIYLLTNLIRGRTQLLAQPQYVWTIGRDPRQTSLTLQDSRLSRCHAAIQYIEGKGFYLVDLGSSNGSFANGELVKNSILLRDGTQIRLGSLTFIFFACESFQTLEALAPERVAQISARRLSKEGLETKTCDRPSHRSCDRQAPAAREIAGKNSFNPIDETLQFMRDELR